MKRPDIEDLTTEVMARYMVSRDQARLLVLGACPSYGVSFSDALDAIIASIDYHQPHKRPDPVPLVSGVEAEVCRDIAVAKVKAYVRPRRGATPSQPVGNPFSEGDPESLERAVVTGNVIIGNYTFEGPLPEDSPTTDADPAPTGVEAEVCRDIAARQRLGIAKYGHTLESSGDDMMQHAYEEALDLAAYLKAEIIRRKGGAK